MPSILLPFVVNILALGLLVWAGIKNRYVMYGLLGFFFLWAFVAFDLTTEQKVFYPLLLALSIPLVNSLGVKTNAESADANLDAPGGRIKGWTYHLFTIGLGIAITIMMFFMQGTRPFRILGYPTLSASSLGGITEVMAPTLSGALGMIENVAFIAFLVIMIKLIGTFIDKRALEGVWAWLSSNPVTAIIFTPIRLLVTLLGPVLPVVLTGFAFGIFHINSYGLEVAAMVWAGLIFVIWIGAWYYTNKDTTPMDIAHYLWNAINTGRATFQVAF